ncbi:MAG: PAS domain S-box protein [Planctomycetota bacterium]
MNDSSSNSPSDRSAYLEEIFASAVDAIVVIDDRGIVRDANPALERVFGFEPHQVVGKNVSMLMPSPDRERHDQYLNHYLKTSERKIIGIGREVTGLRKDNSQFPMHLAVSEIQSDSKRLFVGIIRDISDLKEAEEQLRELNDQLDQRVQLKTEELRSAQAELVKKEKLATLGQVSGGIAHEIRNPLNVVKTSTYFLCNAKSPSQEKVREHLARIDRQVNMIDSVVTALSDVARLPDPEPTACGIEDLLHHLAATIQFDSAIELRQQLPPNVPDAKCDAAQIQIVFRNLLRNAKDAMPDGGTIFVTADILDEDIVVYVRDEGIGIAPEEMRKIMEPLYSTKARGMGLGLAISIAILQKNAGTLAVESELNVGTTFSVTLPLWKS